LDSAALFQHNVSKDIPRSECTSSQASLYPVYKPLKKAAVRRKPKHLAIYSNLKTRKVVPILSTFRSLEIEMAMSLQRIRR